MELSIILAKPYAIKLGKKKWRFYHDNLDIPLALIFKLIPKQFGCFPETFLIKFSVTNCLWAVSIQVCCFVILLQFETNCLKMWQYHFKP
uniref:Uncharacterized protein n=1 Tax=Rhizophora mucronata TaxID=61149 RepID=A0A2P2MYY9_RHIMU